MTSAADLLTAARAALAATDQEVEALRLAQEILDQYAESPEATSAKRIIDHITPPGERPRAPRKPRKKSPVARQTSVQKAALRRGKILLSTTDEIDGCRTVTTLGVVRGSTVRSRHIGSEFGASLKSIVGGELKGVTKLIADAREQALARMLNDAKSLGANGIKGLRFSTSQVWEGASEVLVYGTAVTVEPIDEQKDKEEDDDDIR